MPDERAKPPTERYTLGELLSIMARLRDPETGCPWDVQQSYASIAPYTIEEAYEVADAIARDDLDALKEESSAISCSRSSITHRWRQRMNASALPMWWMASQER